MGSSVIIVLQTPFLEYRKNQFFLYYKINSHKFDKANLTSEQRRRM